MSVALMEIYDHFRNTDTASIDDDHFSPVVTFANRVLGEHVLLQKLRVTKSELEAYDDDDLQDKRTRSSGRISPTASTRKRKKRPARRCSYAGGHAAPTSKPCSVAMAPSSWS